MCMAGRRFKAQTGIFQGWREYTAKNVVLASLIVYWRRWFANP